MCTIPLHYSAIVPDIGASVWCLVHHMHSAADGIWRRPSANCAATGTTTGRQCTLWCAQCVTCITLRGLSFFRSSINRMAVPTAALRLVQVRRTSSLTLPLPSAPDADGVRGLAVPPPDHSPTAPASPHPHAPPPVGLDAVHPLPSRSPRRRIGRVCPDRAPRVVRREARTDPHGHREQRRRRTRAHPQGSRRGAVEGGGPSGAHDAGRRHLHRRDARRAR